MEITSFSLNLDAFKIIIGLFDSMETEFCFVAKKQYIEMISFLALLDVTSMIIGLGDSMICKSHYMGYYFSTSATNQYGSLWRWRRGRT